MPEFTLERIIRATPDEVYAASLDPRIHLASMARYDERMLEGPMDGIFTEGSTVTWRARHFGIRFRLTSLVYDLDPPHGFRDRQVRGPFRSFCHEHVFLPHPDGTLMRDTVGFRSPARPLGRLVDRLLLGSYMRRLIEERNDALMRSLEA